MPKSYDQYNLVVTVTTNLREIEAALTVVKAINDIFLKVDREDYARITTQTSELLKYEMEAHSEFGRHDVIQLPLNLHILQVIGLAAQQALKDAMIDEETTKDLQAWKMRYDYTFGDKPSQFQ